MLLRDYHVRLRDLAVETGRPITFGVFSRRGVPDTWRQYLALLDETYSRRDWLADCARIRCPVQVIAGSEDSFPTVEMSRRLAQTIPGARLHVVEGGAHFPNRSHRAEVQGVVGEFLGSLER